MYKKKILLGVERWYAKAEKAHVCKYIHQVHLELMMDLLVSSVIYELVDQLTNKTLYRSLIAVADLLNPLTLNEKTHNVQLTPYDQNLNLKIAKYLSHLNFLRWPYSIMLRGRRVLPSLILSILYETQKFGLSLATSNYRTLTIYNW